LLRPTGSDQKNEPGSLCERDMPVAVTTSGTLPFMGLNGRIRDRQNLSV